MTFTIDTKAVLRFLNSASGSFWTFFAGVVGTPVLIAAAVLGADRSDSERLIEMLSRSND